MQFLGIGPLLRFSRLALPACLLLWTAPASAGAVFADAADVHLQRHAGEVRIDIRNLAFGVDDTDLARIGGIVEEIQFGLSTNVSASNVPSGWLGGTFNAVDESGFFSVTVITNPTNSCIGLLCQLVILTPPANNPLNLQNFITNGIRILDVGNLTASLLIDPAFSLNLLPSGHVFFDAAFVGPEGVSRTYSARFVAPEPSAITLLFVGLIAAFMLRLWGTKSTDSGSPTHGFGFGEKNGNSRLLAKHSGCWLSIAATSGHLSMPPSCVDRLRAEIRSRRETGDEIAVPAVMQPRRFRA